MAVVIGDPVVKARRVGAKLNITPALAAYAPSPSRKPQGRRADPMRASRRRPARATPAVGFQLRLRPEGGRRTVEARAYSSPTFEPQSGLADRGDLDLPRPLCRL